MLSRVMEEGEDGGGVNVPLPLDHFFFCFLPPVAAGAYSQHGQQCAVEGEGGVCSIPF